MSDAPETIVTLDVRNLEPPIPMEKALARIGRMASGQVLRLVIHREPFPLYELLDGMGYAHRTEAQPGGDFVVIIEERPRSR
jgi:uncharacterized protein (DUF2249 family)